MANALNVNDILELKWYCVLNGQYSVNTRHYKVFSVTGAGKTDSQALTQIQGDLAPFIKNIMSNEARYLGDSAQIIRPVRRPATFSSTETGVGLVASDALPPYVAGLLSFVSNTANRHGRGRNFIAFPAESDNDPTGIPSVAYRAGLIALGAYLDVPLEIGTLPDTVVLTPVLYDRTTHATVEVTDSHARTVWSHCKRRSMIRGGDRPPL